MINPFKEAERIEKIVCKDNKRKYYRFRATRFYGGIASADCVGCILDCAYCWSQAPRKNPGRMGRFYSPEEVAQKLINIAKEKGYSKVRITGNEPTLCKEHLLEVISQIPKNFLFILETNGILIDKKFARDLSEFKNPAPEQSSVLDQSRTETKFLVRGLHVRVSLKGSDEKMFSLVTNAEPEFFKFQLEALKNLTENDISCNAAIMIDLYRKEDVLKIRRKLQSISSSLLENLEFETLILYPFVRKNLKERGIEIYPEKFS